MARRGYVVGGSHWISDSAYAKRLAKDWAISTRRPVEVRTVDERGDFGRVIYTARPTKKNVGRMTKAQRAAKTKRAATRRRKINAAVVAWKKMNPGKKVPAALKIKPTGGGGFSVTPLKMNRGGIGSVSKRAFRKSGPGVTPQYRYKAQEHARRRTLREEAGKYVRRNRSRRRAR